jgi:TonB family protein
MPGKLGVDFRIGDFTMFTFDTTDLQRLAVSTLGAVALSATCIGAAIAPSRAATPIAAAATAWQAAVERKLDARTDAFSLHMPSGKRTEAVVAIRFAADGTFASADIARSTGNRALDRHALNVASKLDYPLMPEPLRGKPQTVAMRLFFGRADSQPQYIAMQERSTGIQFAAANRSGNPTVVAK